MIIHDIEQGSYEWFELRNGMVTSSRLPRVFKADYLSVIDELISEQLSGTWEDSGFVNDAMQRGIDLEPIALQEYEAITGVQIVRGGFIQSSEFPLLGYSPDGRVGNIGGVEVKCPSSKKHIQYLRQQQVPNDYKWQVLISFLINPSIEWYDFMSYDPRISQKPVFIIRTERKEIETELADAKIELAKFFTKLETIKSKILF